MVVVGGGGVTVGVFLVAFDDERSEKPKLKIMKMTVVLYHFSENVAGEKSVHFIW